MLISLMEERCFLNHNLIFNNVKMRIEREISHGRNCKLKIKVNKYNKCKQNK